MFHLGDANDYHEKVLQYMQETEAYEEITSGVSPLAANLQQIISLLNYLYYAGKPLLTKKQYVAMYPNKNEIESGHLYFIPKPHKVCILFGKKTLIFISIFFLSFPSYRPVHHYDLLSHVFMHQLLKHLSILMIYFVQYFIRWQKRLPISMVCMLLDN